MVRRPAHRMPKLATRVWTDSQGQLHGLGLNLFDAAAPSGATQEVVEVTVVEQLTVTPPQPQPQPQPQPPPRQGPPCCCAIPWNANKEGCVCLTSSDCGREARCVGGRCRNFQHGMTGTGPVGVTMRVPGPTRPFWDNVATQPPLYTATPPCTPSTPPVPPQSVAGPCYR